MGRGFGISVRDRLIVYNCVSRGITSPAAIKKAFDDADERPISLDSIRKLIGEFEELKMLLPEYPSIQSALAIGNNEGFRRTADPILVERRKEHWDRLRELARQFEKALLMPHPSQLFIPGIPHLPLRLVASNFLLGTSKEEGKRRVVVTLEVEENFLFPSLLSHLKAEFADFHQFGAWKDKLGELVDRCHQLASSIYQNVGKAVGVTQRKTGEETGIFTDFPRFVYESVLHRAREKAAIPDLEVGSLKEMPTLTPKGLPALVLARGNPEEISRYKKTFSDEVRSCLSLPLPGQINDLEQQLRDWSNKTFRPVLALVIERGTFKPTKDCLICKDWPL